MALTEDQKKALREAGQKRQQVSSYVSPSERLRQREEARMAQRSSGFLNDVSESLSNRLKDLTQTGRETVSGEITPLETGVRFFGDVIGGASDVAGAGVSALTPEPVKEAGVKLLNTEAGKRGLSIVKKFTDAYSAFKEKNPRIAETIEGLGNIASVLPIGAGAKAGQVGVRTTAKGAAEAIETISGQAKNLIKKSGQKLGDAKSVKILKDVGEDVIPTKQGIVNYQISQALDLTPGDIRNIQNSTGNSVGEFLSSKNLVRDSVTETKEAIDEFFGQNYKQVREEISKVPTAFSTKDVPSYEKALSVVKNDMTDVPGLEQQLAEVNRLLSSPAVTLSDVQRSKEIIDDHFKLYKVTGDPAAGTKKEGIRNLRSDLREFIESQVKQETGADIKQLNNNVATARAISDSITTRAPRSLTRNFLSLGDVTTYGTGAYLGSPLYGAAAVFAKKVIESPTARLRFAKWLGGLDDAKKFSVSETLRLGNIPSGLPAEIQKIVNSTPELIGAITGAGITAAAVPNETK